MDYRDRRRIREETASMDQRTNKEKYGVDSILPDGDEWEYLPPVVEGMFRKFGNIIEASKKDTAGRMALKESARQPVHEMASRYMDTQFDPRASFGRKAMIDTQDNGIQLCKICGWYHVTHQVCSLKDAKKGNKYDFKKIAR